MRYIKINLRQFISCMRFITSLDTSVQPELFDFDGNGVR